MKLIGRRRECPACNHRFIPWQCWRITRWTTIKCPSCRSDLGRNIDPVAIALTVAAISIIVWPQWPTQSAKIIAIIVMVAVVYVIDALTMRLVVRCGDKANDNKSANKAEMATPRKPSD